MADKPTYHQALQQRRCRIPADGFYEADSGSTQTAVHDRMPVILDLEGEARWFDPAVTDPVQLQPLLIPCSLARLQIQPMGTTVNTTRLKELELMAPLAG